MSNETQLKLIDIFLKKYDETGEVCDENSEIWKKVAEVLVKAGCAYKVGDIRRVTVKYDGGEERTHHAVLLYGGNNGYPQWAVYLASLSNVFASLLVDFEQAWLMELDNDCLDDVHYVYLGVR